MENQYQDHTYDPNIIQLEDVDASRRFMANVFLWMFVALALSAGCAYIFAHNLSLLTLLVNFETGRRTLLGTVVMFSPIAFVLLMSFGLNRLSFSAIAALFIAYATLTGISLSFIFFIYTASSIAGVFITASALFGVMAVAGYTTHQDLTKFGSLMIMGLVGVLIASLVNFFMHSDQLAKIINYVGVAVFVGLTAYDVQKLKRIGAGTEYGEATTKKLAIMGALGLYLDFINMFLFLLRIFGRRK